MGSPSPATSRISCQGRARSLKDGQGAEFAKWRRVGDEGVRVLSVAATLTGAALLGGLLGLEREWLKKPAGLRTHMLVALGAAVFVLGSREAGMAASDLSRVVQGVAAGVGFIGAGTILKIASEREIQGLTTAASVWLAAAIGVAVGAGLIWLPVLTSVIVLAILGLVGSGSRPSNLALDGASAPGRPGPSGPSGAGDGPAR